MTKMQVVNGQFSGMIGEVVSQTKSAVKIRRADGKGVMTFKPVDVVEVAPATVDIAQVTLHDGYIGHFGKTWKDATAQSFETAITGAMEMNSLSREQVIEKLAAGEVLNWRKSSNFFYDHSYGQVMVKRQPVAEKLVRCDCGHSVPEGQVMNANRGTACPACYDRLS